MRFKKWLTALLAAAFMAACVPALAGCGGDGPKDQNYEPNLDIDFDVTATITVATTADPKEKALVTAVAAKFKEYYNNVTVQTREFGGANFNNAIEQEFKANPKGMPDIITTNSAENFNFIEKGILLNLQNYVNAEEDRWEGGGKWAGQYIDSMWKLGQKNFDGDQYLVPRTADRAVVHYNKSFFTRALSPATLDLVQNGWTWDDFLQVCAELRTDYDTRGGQWTGRYIVDCAWNWESIMFPILESCGAKVCDANGNITINSAETRAALNLMRNMVDKRYCAPLNLSSGGFEQGYSSMFIHSVGAKFVEKPITTLGYEYDLVSFPLVGNSGRIGAGIPGYGIYSGSANRDIAWKFLSFMLTDEGQNALADGGAATPPMRKDMQDPMENNWGTWALDGETLKYNLDAYVWEPERNFATTFFTKYNPGYQSALIGAVAKMVTGYLNEPKGNLESLVAGCKTDLEYVISGGK